MRTLSAPVTYIIKYIVPIAWIGGFGLGTINSLLYSGAEFWQLFSALLIGSPLIYLIGVPIKKVEMDDDGYIYISNFIRSEKIHKSRVVSVSGSVLFNPNYVWFRVKDGTSFGNIIVFIPNIGGTFGKSPMVNKLKRLCGLSE